MARTRTEVESQAEVQKLAAIAEASNSSNSAQGPVAFVKKESMRGKVKSDFPKFTLEEALKVPKALEEANGGQPLPPTETAIAMQLSPGNADFRSLLSASLKYGLTT